MLKNFLLVAFRNIMRSRLYSLINILGLTIGLATSLFIAIYVKEELNYDKHFSAWENIYRLHMHAFMNGNEMSISTTGSPAAETIKREIPGVIATTRLISGGKVVKVGEIIFTANRVFHADSTFFDIFDYPIVKGEKKNLLNKPYTVVLTESTAKKYFGNINPIGQSLKIDNVDYTITGVSSDCRRTSHFHYDILASMVSLESAKYSYWLNYDIFNIYVKLDPRADINKINSAIQEIVLKKVEPEIKTVFGITIKELYAKGNWVNYSLFPISDIHLNSHTMREIEPNSNIIYIYIFIVISMLIMVLACINYMNLSTARSANRSKETAIRKVLGAKRGSLINQYLIESIFQSLFALLLALILIETILPIFNRSTQLNLSIGYTSNYWVIPILVLTGVVIGLVSGVYSSIQLSSVDTLHNLKSKILSAGKHRPFRNGLVVFQFSISIFILIATFIIYSQLKYTQNRDTGYDKNKLLIIKTEDIRRNDIEVYKQRLKAIPGITDITATSSFIGESFNGFPSKSEDEMNVARVSRMLVAEKNFDKTMKLSIIDGRYFSDDFKNDTFSIVINETAAKEYNFNKPVGKHMVTQFNGVTIKWKIIGVVKDFNFNSLHDKISSLVIVHPSQGNLSNLVIRYGDVKVDDLLKTIKSTWSELYPNVPFDYYFFDQKYKSLYSNEYTTGKLFATFSILAIVISCLGLFGLASFLAERRSREIAIRKVVGASERKVVVMLLKQFTFWTLIANVVAYPAAWLFAKGWLRNFAYHVDIKVWYFLIATIVVFAIAIVTVASQALTAARTNPADKLKYE